ncbi:MAG: hypothetical protein ABFD65_15010 [Candidatus Polarisedimenticolia bacterium]
MRIRPELIESVAVIDDDSTEISASSTFYEVSETPEEVLLIVEGADGTAAVVEAARRMIAWLDDSGATYAAHEAIVRDLRSALAAMEVPRG